MPRRDKAAKFVELANRRVNRAIRDLRLIGNLASRKNYAYTDEQARKIVRVLQKEIEGVKRSFDEPQDGVRDEFSL